MKTLIKIIYYLSMFLFIVGILSYYYNPFEFKPTILIGLSIIIPIIFDYKKIVSSDAIEMFLYVFITCSGYLVLAENKFGLLSYLILQSVLFAKQGGLIFKKQIK